MTTIRISFRSEQAEALLARLAGQTSNMPGLLKNIGQALMKTQMNRFRTGTDPAGARWAPLSPLTVSLRGGSGPVLWRSGRLMNSSAYDASGSTLRVGINTIDAAVHQFGATIVPKNGKTLAIPVPARRGGPNMGGVLFLRRAKIPARPIVGFGLKDEQATRDTITDWLAISG